MTKYLKLLVAGFILLVAWVPYKVTSWLMQVSAAFAGDAIEDFDKLKSRKE